MEDGDRPEIQKLIAEKQRLTSTSAPAGRTRHVAIETINHQLQDYVSKVREKLLQQRGDVEEQLARSAVLSSRDYPFCLYSEPSLRPWLLDAATKAI